MNRRGFLKSILAAGVAPAFVGSSVLMPVRKLWTPEQSLMLWGDGIRDDTLALQAWLDGKSVVHAFSGRQVGRVLFGGSYLVTNTLWLTPEQPVRELVSNTFVGRVKDGPILHVTPRSPDEPARISYAQVFAGKP